MSQEFLEWILLVDMVVCLALAIGNGCHGVKQYERGDMSSFLA